jgi:protease-4
MLLKVQYQQLQRLYLIKKSCVAIHSYIPGGIMSENHENNSNQDVNSGAATEKKSNRVHEYQEHRYGKRADDWSKDAILKIASANLSEQTKARKWGIFFKSLMSFYMFLTLGATLAFWYTVHDAGKVTGKHTSMVSIIGPISADAPASSANLIPSLQKAFKDEDTEGVIIHINSPGGSPVQSGQINDEIYRLKAAYPKIPVYTVVDDICASGGYYIAAATDKIFVDKASMIGSIGVRMDGFGFTGIMEKLGVERRSITAGSNKSLLDPFLPAKPNQKIFIEGLLGEVHQQFINVVRTGRGKRLHETDETFSGLIWNGAKGVEMGLADGLGTVESVARDVIKAEKVVDYTVQEGAVDRLVKKFGVSVGSALPGFKLEENAGMIMLN